MIVVADSGSTKCDWLLIKGNAIVQTTSQGLNPYHVCEEDFIKILETDINKTQNIKTSTVEKIFFYGAGCGTAQKQNEVKNWIKKIYPQALVEVASDLLAAARACCNNEQGIVAILGTGSNSCVYDGLKIIDQQISLGYILGDEGSGAHLGKELLKKILEEELPQHIIQKFYTVYPFSLNEILENIYSKPAANRYLAAFTKFIGDNIQEESLYNLAHESIHAFIKKNILKYKNHQNYTLHFVGSVAWYFKDIVEDCCRSERIICGNFIIKPIDKLINYHCQSK